MDTETLPEREESLWLLIAGLGIWAAHFLLCYVTAAIWCAKIAGPAGPFGGVRIAVAIYTVVALTAIGISIFEASRRHQLSQAAMFSHIDASADRHRFLGKATLLLSGLSFIATLLVGLVAYVIGSCQ